MRRIQGARMVGQQTLQLWQQDGRRAATDIAPALLDRAKRLDCARMRDPFRPASTPINRLHSLIGAQAVDQIIMDENEAEAATHSELGGSMHAAWGIRFHHWIGCERSFLQAGFSSLGLVKNAQMQEAALSGAVLIVLGADPARVSRQASKQNMQHSVLVPTQVREAVVALQKSTLLRAMRIGDIFDMEAAEEAAQAAHGGLVEMLKQQCNFSHI